MNIILWKRQLSNKKMFVSPNKYPEGMSIWVEKQGFVASEIEAVAP